MNFSHLFEPVPLRDWWVLAALFGGILILVALAELLRRWRQWPAEFTRKLVHILVGVMLFFLPVLLQTSLPMLLLGGFFTVANFAALQKGWLKGMHGARFSYGTVFYPLSFLVLVLLCWPDQVVVLITAMLVLALGDAAAAIVGEGLPRRHTYRLIREQKSLEGSLAMFLVSAAVIFLILHFYPPLGKFAPLSTGTALWFGLVSAAIATAAEALSHRGSDNLTVPLFTALFLYFLLNPAGVPPLQITAGVLLGLVAAAASPGLKFLSPSGAVATFLLAALIFGFGAWAWTIPVLTFFVLSSLLSQCGKSVKQRYHLIFEKGSRRDWAQVLANGGIPGLLMILHAFSGDSHLYFLYLAALAAATADSWGTEIGTLFQQTPRLVTTGQKVAPGTSGGITVAGTLGGTAGAGIIALSGWLFFREYPGAAGWLPAAVLCGCFGSLTDSLLGATVQAQYRCEVCGQITERTHHCAGRPTRPIAGYRRINNDGVNFLSNGAAALLGYFWLIF